MLNRGGFLKNVRTAAAAGIVGWAGLCAAETVVCDHAVENAPWKLTGETAYVSSNRASQFTARALIDLAGEKLDVRLGGFWENVWLNGTTITNSSDRPALFRFHSPRGKLHVVTREWRGGPGNVLDASHGRLYLRTKTDSEDCWSMRLGAEGDEQVMGGGVTGADASRYLWAGPVEFAGDVTFADDTNARAGGWGLRLTGSLSGPSNATVTLSRAFALQIASRENAFAGRWDLRGGGDGTYRCRLELMRGAAFSGRSLRIADSDVILDAETAFSLPSTRVVSGEVRISGGAAGSRLGSVLKQGGGTLTIAGPLSVPGNFRLEEGAVVLDRDALGRTPSVARMICLGGTTLDLRGNAVVIDELVGSPTLLNAERLQVNRRRDSATGTSETAKDLLVRLKKVAASAQVLWAWTEEWVTWGSMDYGTWPRYRTRIGKLTGRAPLMCYYDLGSVVGTAATDAHKAEAQRVMSEAIRTHWRACRGIPVFSWHMDHPCTTNGFPAAWYRYKCGEHPKVIADILSGREYPCGINLQWCREKRTPAKSPRAWYFARLDEIATFFARLTDDEGCPIPLVLRYEHEMDGGWFWWGKGWCTPNEFVALSRLEADYLRGRLGKDRILFAYTPDRTWKELGAEGDGGHNFLSWYPGDDYVDIMGFDDYSIGKGKTEAEAVKNFNETLRKLRLVGGFARARGKVLGISETGCRDARNDFWASLLKLATADGLGCAFVNTWSGPWTLPDTPEGIEDQRRFIASPAVLTISDDAFQQAADAND